MKFQLTSKYYKPIMASRKRHVICYGGRSSGKSYVICQKLVIMLMSEEYCKIIAMRKVYANVKRSIMDTIWSIIEKAELEAQFTYYKSPLEIKHLPTGNTCIAAGADEVGKVKSLAEPTVAFFEEANQFTFDDYVTINTSLRSSRPNVLIQFIMSLNPEDETHWIPMNFFPPKESYEKADGSHTYVLSSKKDTIILHSNYTMNDFLTEADKDTIRSLKSLGDDNNYVKSFVYGNWTEMLEGKVFTNIKYANKFPPEEDCKVFGYSIDFGFSQSQTGIARCALAHGELWLEEVTYRTGLPNIGNDSIVTELIKAGVRPTDDIVGDGAEPKSIYEIKREGFNITGAKKGGGSIEAGLAQMKRYVINIVGDSPNLKMEMNNYRYKMSKDPITGKEVISSSPVKAYDHILDGARYFFTEKIMTPAKTFQLF